MTMDIKIFRLEELGYIVIGLRIDQHGADEASSPHGCVVQLPGLGRIHYQERYSHSWVQTVSGCSRQATKNRGGRLPLRPSSPGNQTIGDLIRAYRRFLHRRYCQDPAYRGNPRTPKDVLRLPHLRFRRFFSFTGARFCNLLPE